MEPVNVGRRHVLAATVIGAAAITAVGAPSAFGQSSDGSSFGPLRRIKAGDLEVAFAEAGPASGMPVLLLHGWPYDIHTYVDVAPSLAAAGHRVIVGTENPRTAELLKDFGFEAEKHPVPQADVRSYGLESITNLIVRRRYGEGRTVALNAHGDVVPPGDGWTHDP